jgi:hypothetical protein
MVKLIYIFSSWHLPKKKRKKEEEEVRETLHRQLRMRGKEKAKER